MNRRERWKQEWLSCNLSSNKPSRESNKYREVVEASELELMLEWISTVHQQVLEIQVISLEDFQIILQIVLIDSILQPIVQFQIIWDQKGSQDQLIDKLALTATKTVDSCLQTTSHLTYETIQIQEFLQEVVKTVSLSRIESHLVRVSLNPKQVQLERVQAQDYMPMFSLDCTTQRLASLAMAHPSPQIYQLKEGLASNLPHKQTDSELITVVIVLREQILTIEAGLEIGSLESIITPKWCREFHLLGVKTMVVSLGVTLSLIDFMPNPDQV